MEHCLILLTRQHCYNCKAILANPNSSTSWNFDETLDAWVAAYILASPKPGPWWKTSARWQVFDLTPPRTGAQLPVEICLDLLRFASSVTFEFDHFGRPRFQNMVWNDAKDPYRLSKPARQFEMMQVRELPGKWWWWVRLMVDGSCSFIHGAPSSQACCGARVPGDSRTIQKRAQHDQQCESQSCKNQIR